MRSVGNVIAHFKKSTSTILYTVIQSGCTISRDHMHYLRGIVPVVGKFHEVRGRGEGFLDIDCITKKKWSSFSKKQGCIFFVNRFCQSEVLKLLPEKWITVYTIAMFTTQNSHIRKNFQFTYILDSWHTEYWKNNYNYSSNVLANQQLGW